MLSLGTAWAEEENHIEVRASEQGTMEIRLQGKENCYYILYRSLDLREPGDPVEMALGRENEVLLKDRFRSEPGRVFYRVRELSLDASEDTDGDGILDAKELLPNLFVPDRPNGNVFNPIKNVRAMHGSYVLTQELWDEYSVRPGTQAITPGLAGSAFLKFLGLPNYDPGPALLFLNTKRHRLHGDFIDVLRGTHSFNENALLRGEMAWIPGVGGEEDWYVFNLQPGNTPSFEHVRFLYHALTKNMPFIDGNLAYQPIDASGLVYLRDQHLFEREGIPIWSREERRPGFYDYASLNPGEAYGLLRVFDADERPTILDVALYRQLPNDVPLLRGIITETPQTPLSHVNLRAIQNHNPNAYVREASHHPKIKPLIGKYVHYVVHANGFEIREVTKEEVEANLVSIRPEEAQIPPRDLSQKAILALEALGFHSSTSVGAKAANVAELMTAAEKMRIPREVFPEMGYAVPFYFYDAFMRHNGLYEKVRAMMASAEFEGDSVVRAEALKDLRREIKDGAMPNWMLDELSAVQAAFPPGQGIRCRSSTNNEDLPGFNGAGLYASFTHHPDEGHLSKSVKQVFASLWNFLAFEHREFYRVDHFQAAMGVLMHPNYEDEMANGVAVSKHHFGEIGIHPYYANTQVGEDLVTNPGIASRPEEVLLSAEGRSVRGVSPDPIRFAPSNQVPFGEVILTDSDGRTLADYLSRIVSHFRRLYGVGAGFAMEIEFKITREEALIIKQARPWVD